MSDGETTKSESESLSDSEMEQIRRVKTRITEAMFEDQQKEIDKLDAMVTEMMQENTNLRVNIRRLLDLVGDQAECRGKDCGEQIWWVMPLGGKPVPYDCDGTPHFATCPNAADFRRRKST